jgi:glycosyltransferase involved in cell wall biosynthesis
VIPNGVERCGEPSGAGPPRPRPQLLFVGSDRFQKRGHRLTSLLAAVPEADLHLVGRFGPGFLARFRRFGDRVRVRGLLAGGDLADAYAGADLLLHPAVGEAFGLVPFEAALAGTASVVAGGHGCGEWFARAGGCVVPPDDAEALECAVAARLADVELRQREARAVAAFARAELTWDRAARAIEDVYRDVLAPGAGSRVRGAA